MKTQKNNLAVQVDRRNESLAIALIFAVAINYIPMLVSFKVNGYESSWFCRHLSNFLVIFLFIKSFIKEKSITVYTMFGLGYFISFCGFISDYKFIDLLDNLWKPLSLFVFSITFYLILSKKYIDIDNKIYILYNELTKLIKNKRG